MSDENYMISNEEIEDVQEESSELKGPFNPTDIDVDISTINLGSVLDDLKDDIIFLSPEFQRASDVWSTTKKSRLIESILLGLPLPSFYLSEDPKTNKLVIVDGLQRLCALKDFCITKKLKLTDLQFLTQFEGKSYDDLDRTETRRIRSLKLTINTLRKSTPAKVKFVIFQRVNSGGVPLNPQEMRNALYQGKATRLLSRMVNSNNFKLATGGKIDSKRMVDCDFANRFLAFYLDKDNYGDALDSFMGDALESVNKMDESKIDMIYNDFDRAMWLCYEMLGKNAFRRPDPNKNGKYLKVNKAIFEVLGVSLAKLSQSEQERLKENKSLFTTRIYKLFVTPDFIRSVSSGTAKKTQVDYRYEEIYKLIQSIIEI